MDVGKSKRYKPVQGYDPKYQVANIRDSNFLLAEYTFDLTNKQEFLFIN